MRLGEFAHSELGELAGRYGVSLEDLIRHAALYYLADADSAGTGHRPLALMPEGGRLGF